MASALPGHLFQTYAAYKIGTREVVHWLCQNTDHCVHPSDVNSIWRLEQLGEVAVRKQIQVSPAILRTLRRTIKARNRVGAYFKSMPGAEQQEANSTHSHFTSVLIDIYCRLAMDIGCVRASPSQEQKAPVGSSNMFEGLAQDESEGDSASDRDRRIGEPLIGKPPVGRKMFDIDGPLVNAGRSLPPRPRSNGATDETRDAIGEFMALSMYLSQLDKLFAVVQGSWQAAAAGDMPVVVASFTTSICYQSAELLRPYLDEYSVSDPEALLARYKSCIYCLKSEALGSGRGACSAPNLEGVPFAKADDLLVNWCALKEFKQRWKADATASHILDQCSHPDRLVSLRPPYDDVRRLFPAAEAEERQNDRSKRRLSPREYVDIILERVGQLISLQSKTKTRLPCHTPLLGELATFLQSDDDVSADKIGLSFGLLLMLESLESYFRPAEQFHFPPLAPLSRADAVPLTPPPSRGSGGEEAPLSMPTQGTYLSRCASPSAGLVERKGGEKATPVPNCRINSLSLANDIKSGIEQLLRDPNPPCGCLHIGNTKVLVLMANCHRLVSEFTLVTNFDLYHQAPWVAGMDMLQNLMRASDCGLKSWHHAYFVGTVMHIYNSLVRLEALDPARVPVMESLCRIFSDTVFLGPRPQRNLWGCYQRWCGSRLSFPARKCQDMHTHSQPASKSTKKWKLERVHDVSQGGDDCTRSFALAKVSVLASAMDRNSVTGDDLLLRIYNPAKARNPSQRDIQKARNSMKSSPFIAQHIQHVQGIVLSEFSDESPVAKLNYMQLYETCCEILRRISNADHTVQERGHICSNQLQALIYEASQYVDHGQPMRIVRQRCVVGAAVDAFREVLEGKSLSDFTWRV